MMSGRKISRSLSFELRRFVAVGLVWFCFCWHPRFASGLSRDAGLVCLCLRWHPRFVIGASRVAPVRGGIRFWFVSRRWFDLLVFDGIRVLSLVR